MEKKQLDEILERHKLFLCGDEKGKRADLCEANLYGANLCGADLCEANLCGADLCEANLYGANLCEANLYGADLGRADLGRADLSRADLGRADLSRADLRGADIDFCSFTLSCKMFGMITDESQRILWMFHWMRMVLKSHEKGEATEFEIKMYNMLLSYANKFHREDVERLKPIEKKEGGVLCQRI